MTIRLSPGGKGSGVGGSGGVFSYILQDGETDKGLEIQYAAGDLKWCLEPEQRVLETNATARLDSPADANYLTITVGGSISGAAGNAWQVRITSLPESNVAAEASFDGSGGGFRITAPITEGADANGWRVRIRLGNANTVFWSGDELLTLQYFSGATVQDVVDALATYNAANPNRQFAIQLDAGTNGSDFASGLHDGTEQTETFANGADAGSLSYSVSNGFIDLEVVRDTTLEEIRQSIAVDSATTSITAAVTGDGTAVLSTDYTVPAGTETSIPFTGGLNEENIRYEVNEDLRVVKVIYDAGDTMQELVSAYGGVADDLKSTDLTAHPEPPTFAARTFSRVGLNPDPGPLTTLSGLTQAQVDARVRAGVVDWAEPSNDDPIPVEKLANASAAAVDQTARTAAANAQADANTAGMRADDAQADIDQFPEIRSIGERLDLSPEGVLSAEEQGGGPGGGLSQDQVDARVRDLVIDGAEEGQTTRIPVDRLSQNIITQLLFGNSSGIQGQRNGQSITITGHIDGMAEQTEPITDSDYFAGWDVSGNGNRKFPPGLITDYVNSQNPDDVVDLSIAGSQLTITRRDSDTSNLTLPSTSGGGSLEPPTVLYDDTGTSADTYNEIEAGLMWPETGYVEIYARATGTGDRNGATAYAVLEAAELRSVTRAVGDADNQANVNDIHVPLGANRYLSFSGTDTHVALWAAQNANAAGAYRLKIRHSANFFGGVGGGIEGFINPKDSYDQDDVGKFLVENSVIKRVESELHEGHGKEIGGAESPGNFVDIPMEDEGGGPGQHFRGRSFNDQTANNLTPPPVSGDFYASTGNVGGFRIYWDGTEADNPGNSFNGYTSYEPTASGNYWDTYTYTPEGETEAVTVNLGTWTFADSQLAAFQTASAVGQVFFLRLGINTRVFFVGSITQPAVEHSNQFPQIYVPSGSGPVALAEYWGAGQASRDELITRSTFDHADDNLQSVWRVQWQENTPNHIWYGRDIGIRTLRGNIEVNNFTPYNAETTSGFQFKEYPAGTYKIFIKAFSNGPQDAIKGLWPSIVQNGNDNILEPAPFNYTQTGPDPWLLVEAENEIRTVAEWTFVFQSSTNTVFSWIISGIGGADANTGDPNRIAVYSLVEKLI